MLGGFHPDNYIYNFHNVMYFDHDELNQITFDVAGTDLSEIRIVFLSG